MDEKNLNLDQLVRCAAEVIKLKDLNRELIELNQDLEARLTDLHDEYMKLRTDMEGMASQGEALVLRKKILVLQNELRLKRTVPQQVPMDQGSTLPGEENRSAEDGG